MTDGVDSFSCGSSAEALGCDSIRPSAVAFGERLFERNECDLVESNIELADCFDVAVSNGISIEVDGFFLA